MSTIHWPHDPALERRARRRAGVRLGWIVHAAVFVLVNLFLATVALVTGRPLHWGGVLGWGFGLAMHGLVVQLYSQGSWFEGLVQREREHLVAQRDPW